MDTYLDLLRDVMENGVDRPDRTGTGTRSVFGRQARFDLRSGFPIVTTKRVHFKSVAHELLWFLAGETNANVLSELGVTIWDEWAGPYGELGPIYGYQWRSWPSHNDTFVDQIKDVEELLEEDPYSRRMLVSAWNPADIPMMALPPCHVMFQLYAVDGELSLHMYQRSADIFLGVPFNIASYALLAHMFAHCHGLRPGDLVISFGDLHLYHNHFDQARTQLGRKPYLSPTLSIRGSHDSVLDVRYEDIELRHYSSWPAIKAPVAV